MSENIINKIIKDNYKIKENDILENNICTKKIKKDKDNDNSFNQLLSLQLLIQKHSGLKELCKNYKININFL